MNDAARALLAHNRYLLAVLETRAQDASLPRLMQTRAERLLAFGAAVAAGEPVPAEDVRALEQLERDLLDCVLRRRDAVACELAALHRRRRAERAYQQQSGGAPRYVDRAG